MKNLNRILLLLVISFLFTACFEDLDDNPISSRDLNDFVWKAMNYNYLYKDNSPNLANDRFATDEDYSSYLNSFETPEQLFESLIYQRQTVDRFSWITSDYIALEQFLNGVSRSNGLEFDFYFEPGSTTNMFGIIRLVLNNSPAESLNLKRGQLINGINGTALTEANIIGLLNQDTYTLNLANYNDNGTSTTDDDRIESTDETVTISKIAYSENPVHRTAILNVEGQNVGYLAYNGFTSDYNTQLNAVFADFQSHNIQQLVLDLRYNPGGSVTTATLLGSMISEQPSSEVFTKLEYNSNLQSNNRSFNFASTFNGMTINSLDLEQVYVITTDYTASASEMIINSLSAYIDVIQIGEQTTGKSQASITIYDSPNFGRAGVNPNHTYALQPLVARTLNKFDDEVPADGIRPTIALEEDPRDYGILGNENEPLLAAAIQHIIDNTKTVISQTHPFKSVKRKVTNHPLEQGMYID